MALVPCLIRVRMSSLAAKAVAYAAATLIWSCPMDEHGEPLPLPSGLFPIEPSPHAAYQSIAEQQRRGYLKQCAHLSLLPIALGHAQQVICERNSFEPTTGTSPLLHGPLDVLQRPIELCRDSSHGTEANRFQWLRVADLNQQNYGVQAETIMRSAMPCSGDGEMGARSWWRP